MRLRIVSDLHLEFHADKGEALLEEVGHGAYDVMVVAGDLASSHVLERSLRLLMKHTPQKRVIYVPGNHDYYGSTRKGTADILRRVEQDFDGKLFVMMGDIVNIETKWFVGTTLWFPWSKPDPLDQWLGDFHHILGFQGWVGGVASEAAWFLKDAVESHSVVITHHMPHERCVSRRFEGSQLNRYFVHHLGDEVVGTPKLWICGHTHDSLDLRIGDCRLVCNPFGYAAREENKAFRPDLTIDV